MGIENEINSRVATMEANKAALSAKFSDPAYQLCAGVQDAIDAEIAKVDAVIGTMNNLKDTALNTVNEQMANLNVDYLNKCGGSTIVDTADIFSTKTTSLTTMADGAYAAVMDSSISEGGANIDNIANPVDTNESNLSDLELVGMTVTPVTVLVGGNITLDSLDIKVNFSCTGVEFPGSCVGPYVNINLAGFTHGMAITDTGGGSGFGFINLSIAQTPNNDKDPTIVTFGNGSGLIGTVTAKHNWLQLKSLSKTTETIGFVNPLGSNCASQIANAAAIAMAPLQTVGDLAGEKISEITDIISDFLSFDSLNSDMTFSMASIGGLLNCGDAMLGAMDNLTPEVLALNPKLATAKASVDEAKELASDPTEIAELARDLDKEANDYEGQASDLYGSMTDKLNSLRTIF